MKVYVSPEKYEDFVVGEVVEHAQRRVVTEADNILFSRLSMHEHPSVFPYAKAGPTPALVNPFVVLGIVGGLAVRCTSQHALANLGWKYVRFHNPVRVGDELRSRTEIKAKRLSAKDPTRGIVTIITYGLVDDATLVSEANRSFLVAV